MPAYDSYVICTSPRSGSTLLCKLLSATGISGDPGSYFHEPSLCEWCTYFGLERDSGDTEHALLSRIFQAAIAKGRGPTDTFGVRLQRHSFAFFTEQLARLCPGHGSDAGRFAAAFGRTLFIHLTREDKIAQAVSFVKAEQTGLWHRAPDGTELERLAPPKDPIYDNHVLKAVHDRFQAYDRDWTAWFEQQGIAPLRIAYEELAKHPVATLRTVLSALGLPADAAAGVEPAVARLSDETSRDWTRRLRADLDLQDHISK
ncbi:Stf0 family sulfotransferase [Roseibium sp. RKSG952]|uniref:Stf0 family sulfotransferase n=1 Tax=Roseibium sp. RKSG952 TaxID=2529384 RepID=UPI0012BC216D|nr:Stf0 family sulfotransferase [Roseibium sp. RKSG952]MTH97981.1 sulfotransferase [Roseibium sp. RKSG952]